MATKRRSKLDLDLLENKTPLYWYRYYLLRDTKFAEDVARLKSALDQSYTPQQLSLGYDLAFMREMDVAVPDEHIEQMGAIAREYKTSTTVVQRYMDGSLKELLQLNPIYFQVKVENGIVILRMSPQITQEQFRDTWRFVEIRKAEVLGKNAFKRKRTPANYELIYYIGKALRRGLDYPAIHRLYQDEKLSGYTGSYATAYTEDQLRDYYQKYKFFDE